MSMAINMPLGGLIDKSLKGEAHFAHEEWLRTYVKRLTNGNKTKLKQALNEVDEAINQWRDGFFISTYDEKLVSHPTRQTKHEQPRVGRHL